MRGLTHKRVEIKRCMIVALLALKICCGVEDEDYDEKEQEYKANSK